MINWATLQLIFLAVSAQTSQTSSKINLFFPPFTEKCNFLSLLTQFKQLTKFGQDHTIYNHISIFFEPFPFLLQEYVWWHHATTRCPCIKILTSVISRFFTKTYFFSSVWRWPMHFTKVFYSRFLNVVPCRKRPLHQVLMDSCSPQCMDSWKQMNAENCGFENLGFCF